ncbi:GGDEF domain-containing protein [Permianibacter sp. IMCC34836]|uniref:GGDEF domain-containing protein n=1 Tax=Permianibacter fluminis TaxID=2738515 RepID=UPI0015529960|nr:GGDEF domain-containing protein [Permianibacter fluminis]NQD38601.1 GGDEF domain-containing protein [Permianibacter fluminis]
MNAIGTETFDNQNSHDKLYQALIAAFPQAAGIYSAQGECLASNAAFLPLRAALDESDGQVWLASSNTSNFLTRQGHSLHRQILTADHQLISLIPTALDTAAASLLPVFHALREGQSLFQAVVSALRQALSWRWVGVTRFLPDASGSCSQVEVLVLWDTDHFAASLHYELPGMPCAVVLEKRQFCRFDEVADLFPQDTMAKAIGARVYAGKIYVDDNGLPLGHVFALHDEVPAADPHIEEVFNVLTALLSAEWRALGAETELRAARAAARTDALTGLWNRRAFDEDLAELEQHGRRRQDQDAVLMLIDLDGMKKVNDSKGHDEGDRLLSQFGQLLATGCRRSDRAYRFGGDEFALLLGNTVSPAVLQTRLSHNVQKLREAGFADIGASAGIAALSEANGERTQWFALADARLYQMKQQHRAIHK